MTRQGSAGLSEW